MKRNIELISASAGSGKTFTLAGRLVQALKDDGVPPEGVVCTTFTVKAATELRERARTALLQAGLVDQAQRLASARIGTVHSVCAALIADFAFELNVAVQPAVLEPRDAQLLLNQALTAVLSGQLAAEASELARRMPSFEWQAFVAKIVNEARSNGVRSDQLAACAARSVEATLSLLPPDKLSEKEAAGLETQLAAFCEAFLKALPQLNDTTKTGKDAADRVRASLSQLRANRMGWADYLALENLKESAKQRAAAEPIHELARLHERHPGMRRDLQRGIELVFELAARVMDAYEQRKRAAGVFDFVDQEVLALQLLGRPQVRSELARKVRLVLVDEFQDTSPLQLAIFLELSRIAETSVWVGDVKQAIYGFRGTDPALMESAIEKLLAGGSPRILDTSYRSRSSLVELCSDVFEKAFAPHGLPADRVRLKAKEPEPKGMSPCLEWWRVEGRKNVDKYAGLASEIVQLLSDSSVRVRDREDGLLRRPRASDVAILCRTNQQCADIASALETRGVRAAVAHRGVLSTLEGRAVLAGLRLWVDAFDSIAAAELARLFTYAAEPEAMLQRLFDAPGVEAFKDEPYISRLAELRETFSNSGPLFAFDRVVEALELDERVLSWGSGPERRANLEALRAITFGYAQTAMAGGVPATAAGLVSHLTELASTGEDAGEALPDLNAVVLDTVWGAKGLEWPIVILYGTPRGRSALGVHVASDAAGFDAERPLEGRWVRLVLSPYGLANIKGAFFDRLDISPMQAEVSKAAEREELRLQYVAMTRPRDLLIIAGGKQWGAGLDELSYQGAPLFGAVAVDEEGVVPVVVAGKGRPVRVRVPSEDALEGERDEGRTGYQIPSRVEHPPAYRQPSSESAEEGAFVAASVLTLRQRLHLSGHPDMATVGDAVHAFLAWDRPARELSLRERKALEIATRFGVNAYLDPKELVSASTAFHAALDQSWPGARLYREWPVEMRLPDRSVVRGSVDLVVETTDGICIVDHKSFPGSEKEALTRAVGHAGQLELYAQAVHAATGKPVLGTFIHLPLLGKLVEVRKRAVEKVA